MFSTIATRGKNKIRFSQNADQQTGNRYTYVNYDKHGRSVESGEYAWTSGGVKFQNFYSLPYVSSGDSVLGKLNELDGLDDGRCAQVNYIYYYPLASGEEIPAVQILSNFTRIGFLVSNRACRLLYSRVLFNSRRYQSLSF